MASKPNSHQYDSVVDELVKIFCKRLEIDIPIIYYSIEEYHKMHPCCDWALEHLYGISCLDCKCICIELDDPRHNDLAVLTDSVAHELMHIKYDDVDHPSWFQKRVEDLIKGKRLGKFKKGRNRV